MYKLQKKNIKSCLTCLNNNKSEYCAPKNVEKQLMKFVIFNLVQNINFQNSDRRPYWIFANCYNCPKLPFWQPSQNCFIIPWEYESTKKIHRKNYFYVCKNLKPTK